MDIIEIYKALVKETFSFKSFKRMSLAKAIFAAIAILPFIILYAASMLVYGAFLVLFKFIESPIDYLMNFIKGEGKEVKHGTQVVVYFVGFPFVIIGKVVSAVLMFGMFILHFVASVIGYIATLGGITFSPFINSPVDRTAPCQTKRFGSGITALFITVSIILLVVVIALTPLTKHIAEQFYGYSFKDFVSDIKQEHKEGKMSDELYQSLKDDINNDRITRENYMKHVYKVQSYVNKQPKIDKITATAQATANVLDWVYTVFVTVNVLAYFHTKRLKEDEINGGDAVAPQIA